MPRINLRRLNIRPFTCYESELDDPSGSVMDHGPWQVNVWKPKDGSSMSRVVVQSDDFTFDAALEISGDFISHEQMLKYAQFICDKLNSGS